MAPDPRDGDGGDDLRERVAELEATVEDQQDTIKRMLPGRRGVLKAGGLLAGGGVLGALTADRAAADVVGQVGTDADRVDVFAGAVDANSVNTVSTSIDNVSEGNTSLFLDAVNAGEGREDSVQETDGVSTSATAIWDGESTTTGFGALIVVYGTGTDVTARFSDIVHFNRANSNIKVIDSVTSASPASRTYSRDGDGLDLAMGSDTYDIAVSAIASRGALG
jgi:hypothetical protein